MSNPAIEIPNVLYRYGMCIDEAKFAEAAALFRHGHIALGGDVQISDPDKIEALWRSMVKTYDCGTSRTRHIITNPIIELADDALSAVVHSCWTVIQQTADFPLQMVASGRYRDEFHVIDGQWWFKEKAYLGIDLQGDMSAHLLGSV
ncbi:nuclear transport factor 2 family protein [Aequoribacter sp.]|uniref:nuclear transport factor 2 family protein n=1 Tax=Aequoribacter sp. TaxID=2847771 RepID=UPI003F6960C9